MRWFGSDGVHRVVRGVTVVGLVLALVGIIQEPLASRAIYGFWEPQFGGSVFGPFINENHFAGWMIMALPLVIGSVCAGLTAGMPDRSGDWRQRLLWLSSPAASKLVLIGLAAIVMGLALVLTFSRAGVICFVVALALSGWFIRRKQTTGVRRAVGLAYVALLAVVGIGWAGVDAIGQEFARASWGDVGGRLTAWQDGLRVVQDFTLTGTGMDTYGTATLLYSADPTTRFTYAHNGYLQLAAEAGLLVGLPILGALVLFIREIRRRFRDSADDTRTYWLRVGAVTGLAAIALQELVDFSLQVPGNMVLFTVLCAIAVHRPPYRRYAS